jgi:hypothetical protein
VFTRWLSNLETVHTAKTREEREAIYRFRYHVYVEELGRELGGVDHEAKTVTDEDDEKDFSIHIYTGTPEEITGSARMRVWPAGEVPKKDFDMLSLDVFPDIDKMPVTELGRLMVKPGMRGKLVLPSLARAGYEMLCSQTGVHLAFCYCAPGLVRHYRKLGFRPYAAPMVPTVDGIHVPLVSVLSDRAYFKKVGSIGAPLVKKFFGSGKREPLDLKKYEHLFADQATPLEVDPSRVWEQVQGEFVAQTASRSKSFLDALPEPVVKRLSQKALVLDIEPETLVTKEGYGEREMFVVLSGAFEVLDGNGTRITVLSRGDLFGEVAFFRDEGKRTATVRSLVGGKLLALRRRFLDELTEDDPKAASQIYFQIGRILADRLAARSALEKAKSVAAGEA